MRAIAHSSGEHQATGYGRPARAARTLVVVILAIVAAALAWLGASIATFEFTRTYKDSPMFLIGLGPLCAAAVVTAAAWLLYSEGKKYDSSTVRNLFAAVVFVLPAGMGVAYSVYHEVIVQTQSYPMSPDLSIGQPSGYTFDYPRDWSLFPPENPEQAPETVTFMSWSALRPGESVPAGGLKVSIGPFAGPPPAAESFAVGEASYAGAITMPDPDQTGPPHVIAIVYSANERPWQVIGTFAESPDENNPNTKPFFDIVRSIRHVEPSGPGR